MIRYPERIDQILEIMGRAWKTVPDYRLRQLMVNLFGTDPFYRRTIRLPKLWRCLLRAVGGKYKILITSY